MKLYTCNYCYSEFEPTRRRVQKYCSNTCRSKAYHARKTTTNTPTTQTNSSISTTLDSPPTETNKIESMSASGVGNATAGALIADGLKSLITSNKNKPATKGDLDDLKLLLTNRYLPINNMQQDQYGRSPFYDVETRGVVYLNINMAT